MCFEFEALYWAKLAEEELKRQEAEKQKQATRPDPADTWTRRDDEPAIA